jgi:hypothetical protein
LRARSGAILVGAAATLLVAGCGGGTRQDAGETNGNYTVDVVAAKFPTNQSLSQHAHLVITVHNAESKTIPDIAVTITDGSPDLGTQVQAFAERLDMPGLASHSRPVWVIDRAPGTCAYSCQSGGPGGAVTAYSNTWALGPLKPGAVATFDWAVTAVSAGVHVVNYRVAAGLNGKAKAQLANGLPPAGSFRVVIHHAPAQAYVNDQGQVVQLPPR